MPFGSGSGGLPTSGGTLTGPLVIAPSTGSAVAALTITEGAAGRAASQYALLVQDEFADHLITMDAAAGIGAFGDVWVDGHTFRVGAAQTFSVQDHNGANALALTDPGMVVQAANGLDANPVASGALSTVAPSSGVAFQCSTARDVYLCVPFTGDATNNAATLKIELSPDNVTFSILDTLSIAAALNLTGAINTPVTFAVPAAWRVKLTATHGTIGTATYY